MTDIKFENDLDRLAYKYGTDKCPQINHCFTPFYYEFLKDKKESIKKVLELGIGNEKDMAFCPHYVVGASLFMWRDFFPNAQIYGADILPETLFKSERIETFLCDERRPSSLRNLIRQTGSDIDLFIDDGSHMQSNQIFACKILMPLLQKDVIYIIEDVRRPEAVMEALNEYDCQLADLTGRRRRNDNLVIVRHKKI